MTSAEAQTILYMALTEPIGLLLRTGNSTQAKQRLYSERKKCQDPALTDLQIRSSPFPDGDLVICKLAVQVPSQGGAKS